MSDLVASIQPKETLATRRPYSKGGKRGNTARHQCGQAGNRTDSGSYPCRVRSPRALYPRNAGKALLSFHNRTAWLVETDLCRCDITSLDLRWHTWVEYTRVVRQINTKELIDSLGWCAFFQTLDWKIVNTALLFVEFLPWVGEYITFFTDMQVE